MIPLLTAERWRVHLPDTATLADHNLDLFLRPLDVLSQTRLISETRDLLTSIRDELTICSGAAHQIVETVENLVLLASDLSLGAFHASEIGSERYKDLLSQREVLKARESDLKAFQKKKDETLIEKNKVMVEVSCCSNIACVVVVNIKNVFQNRKAFEKALNALPKGE